MNDVNKDKKYRSPTLDMLIADKIIGLIDLVAGMPNGSMAIAGNVYGKRSGNKGTCTWTRQI